MDGSAESIPVEDAWSRVLTVMGRGAKRRIAEACFITHQAVSRWRQVPEDHLDIVSELSGIPTWELRPDRRREPRSGSEPLESGQT